MKKKITIQFTMKQLLDLGVHVGHSKKNSRHHTSWMFKGYRSKCVLINISKTFVALKTLESHVVKTIRINRRILFVECEKSFTMYIIRYAMICGELYHIGIWKGGLISNIKSVLFGCYKAYLRKINDYHITHKDVKKMKSIFGLFWNHFLDMPGLVYFSSTRRSRVAVLEMTKLKLLSTGIVDTNTLAWDVNVPIPGNDDSIVCLNFFLYYITSLVLMVKLEKRMRWRDDIRVKSRVRISTQDWLMSKIKDEKRDRWFKDRLYLLINLLKQEEDLIRSNELYSVKRLREELLDEEREFYGMIQPI